MYLVELWCLLGRRGPSPDHAKREAFANLIAEGVPSARACRMVGINPRTGKRWRNGRRIESGGRVLNLPPVITSVVPVAKRYSPRYLSEDERVCLADLRQERRTMREIAALMGRSLSTISRELARGADAVGRYRPFEAHRRALGRRRLHRPSRLARDAELRDWVAGRLKARWSPEQVARALRHEFPDQPERWLCAETIYQAVYRPDLGGLPRELPGRVLRLRRRHRLRRRDARARRAGPLTGMTLIHDRPAEALGREQPGHWEGDLIVGAGNASAIVTIVERPRGSRCSGTWRAPDTTPRPCATPSSPPWPACRRTCGGPSPGTRAPRWPAMPRSPRPSARRASTSATRTHPGSGRPTRTRTACCAPTSPRARTCPSTPPTTSPWSRLELNHRPRKVLGWDSPADRLATLLGPPSVLRR